jgi:hypothetical protein
MLKLTGAAIRHTPFDLPDGKRRVISGGSGGTGRHRRKSRVLTRAGVIAAVHLVRSRQARNLPSQRHAGASEDLFGWAGRAGCIHASHTSVGILRRLLDVGGRPQALVKQLHGGDPVQIRTAHLSLHELLAGFEQPIRLIRMSLA